MPAIGQCLCHRVCNRPGAATAVAVFDIHHGLPSHATRFGQAKQVIVTTPTKLQLIFP